METIINQDNLKMKYRINVYINNLIIFNINNYMINIDTGWEVEETEISEEDLLLVKKLVLPNQKKSIYPSS